MASKPANSQAPGHSLGPSFELSRRYRFEAAHYLPKVAESHPCRRVHGHGYRVAVSISGVVDPQTGWVTDYADIDAVVNPILAGLDHCLLNELAGLENPTSENLAAWLWQKLEGGLPGLYAITVAETEDSSCTFRGFTQ
jgi:6-pyruvoyltetrahydropterin/6-carboxytetrahydropterin synthase